MIFEILGLVCVMLIFFSIMTAEDSNSIRIITSVLTFFSIVVMMAFRT